jgi:hypothetical protein
MRLRDRSIRARIFFLVLVPVLSLIGIYAFATAITASDDINLARASFYTHRVGEPIGFLSAQLQTERLIATVYLAAPAPTTLAALEAQEAKTDKFVSVAEADLPAVARTSSPTLKTGIAVLLSDLAGLPQLRQEISSRTVSMTRAQNDYSAIVAAGYNVILQIDFLDVPNAALATQSVAFMRIAQGMELLLQEQALLVGDVMAGSFPAAAHAEFTELVGEHRWLIAESLPELPPEYRAIYRPAVSPRATATLTALENDVADSRSGSVPRVSLRAYQQASTAVASGLGLASFEAGSANNTAWSNVGRSAFVRLVIAGGAGLLAIIVSIIISVWIGLGLVRQLADLRQSAITLANVRLPQVVRRLSAGETVDVDAEAPLPGASRNEIGQVRQAFNSVQRTAIEAAVGQARLRASISAIFRNLARRSQLLLHRQLALLDALELQASEPEELESLFQIDHLTTRMRRHAEGLVVLAGDRPGRGWTQPVPMVDVLRGAVAEVVDYARIRLVIARREMLEGRAVADVIHVIAELADNATIYSPPNTPVRMVADTVGRGFAVEIEDRGLGMTEEKMAQLNALLANPPEFDVPESDQLGLYVAARLASRHHLKITLRPSPFGGISAIVLIPQELVVLPEGRHAEADEYQALEPSGKPDHGGTGRHASRATPGEAAAPTAPAGTGRAQPAPLAEILTAGDRVPEPHATGPDMTQLDLPRRTPQANLAPQLRDAQAARPAKSVASGGPSPEETRNVLNAMQQGWERARGQAAHGNGAPAPGTERQMDSS